MGEIMANGRTVYTGIHEMQCLLLHVLEACVAPLECSKVNCWNNIEGR